MSEAIKLERTGIWEIDEQHKQLVSYLDRLLSWIAKGYGLAATFDAFEALFVYTQTHFQFEEKLLRDHSYPKLDEHIEEHQAIIAHLKQLKAELEAGEDVADELAKTLREWVLKHIDVEDIDYAKFFDSLPH